jgi:hypothetical protein
MKRGNSSALGRLGIGSGVLFATAILLTPARAQGDSEPGPGKLQGTWITEVAIRVCATGAILRTFPAINTFNDGGTMIDTTTGVSPSLRTPGLGKWQKTGPQTFSAVSVGLLFSPTGTWTATQTLTHAIEVQGNTSTFTTTSEVIDTSGTVTTGCATAAANRM